MLELNALLPKVFSIVACGNRDKITKSVARDGCLMGRKLAKVISCNLRKLQSELADRFTILLKVNIPEIGDIPALLSCYTDVLRHIGTSEAALMRSTGN